MESINNFKSIKRLPIRFFSTSILLPYHFQLLPLNLCRSHRLYSLHCGEKEYTHVISHLAFMLFTAKAV